MQRTESPRAPRSRWRGTRPLLVASVAIAVLFSTIGTVDAQTERTRSTDTTDIRPVQRPETLRLDCAPDFVNGERGVVCQWSEATNPRTRGYQLFKITDGSARELVTRVGVDGRLGFFDTDVTAPSSLVYGVISVNGNGRLLGRSAPVHVQYGQDIAELRLACAPDFVGGQRGVLCRWSPSAEPGTRGYLVYRTTNQGPREIIARSGVDGRTAAFDTDVTAGSRYTYGVTAIDGANQVLAIGGPAHVTWPGTD